MHLKVMKKLSEEAQQVCWAVVRVLQVTGIFFFFYVELVSGNCGSSSFFNLSSLSFDNISLVSDSWIDGDGFVRFAPPTREPIVSTTNISNIVDGNSFGAGQVFYRTPISFVGNTSFSTFFSFSLSSQKPVSPAANGMAFIVVGEPTGVVSKRLAEPLLGGPCYDMWANHSLHFLSVQLNQCQAVPYSNNGTDARQTPIYSSYFEDASVNFAWIDYDAATLRLDLRVSNSSRRPEWVQLSQQVDLAGVFLEKMYVGFSSVLKYTVQSWNFSVRCSPLTDRAQSRHLSAGIQPENLNAGRQSGDLTEGIHTRNLSDKVQSKVSTNSSALNSGSKGKDSSKRNRRLIIYIGASGGGTLVACLLMTLGMRRAWRAIQNRRARETPDREISYAPQIFSYKVLSTATNGFDERALLGRGGFGSVFKGLLPDQETLVAVKRIDSHNNEQRERQFIAEVASIGRVRHHNLVQLLGWCHEKGKLLLVYDYMCNGSLDRLLFKTQESVLPWESRYNILRGVATALAFLHSGWEKQVVHRDVKASNVLLDSDFNPRLGDFGLARLIEHNKNHRSTVVAGTKGYLAPELSITRKATEKTDVFSFGALTLEVACGRRPIEKSLPSEERVLVNFVWGLHSRGEMLNALDWRLQRGQFSIDEVVKVMSLGLLCSHPDPAVRPTMRQVVQILKGDLSCPVVPDCKPPLYSPRPLRRDWHNTTRELTDSSSEEASNKALTRPQARVSDCSSISLD